MDKEIASITLAPCCRPGKEGDWWKEQHIYCTGYHHLNTQEYVKCNCPCHKEKNIISESIKGTWIICQ